MMNTTAYKRMKSGTPGYADKTNEGNQFAQAVQKAKAAGMKAGDKFKVGDDEYTLKDAIEMAGLQVDEFFSEDSHDDWSKLTNALIKRYGEDKAKVITDFAQISTDSGPELMKDHGLTPKNDAEEDMEQYFKKFPYLRKMYNTSWMDRLINIAGEGPDYGTPVKMEVPEEAQAEAEAINTELDRIKTLANIA
jgi:hypothetical protein